MPAFGGDSSAQRRLDQSEIAALAPVEDVEPRAARVHENQKLARGHFELQDGFIDKHRLHWITFRSHDLVLVVLGDHQPSTIVSGTGASHDVPVTVIAHDPAVMARIAGWGWVDGLRPGPQAPVWRMDAFRDRFLAA